MKKLKYLASPYSHKDPKVMEARFRAVCMAAARLMSEGHHIYSPIAHTHPIAMVGALPTDWQFWQAYDRTMLEASGELWILTLPGWQESKGVSGELEIQRELLMSVRLIEPTPEELAILEEVA